MSFSELPRPESNRAGAIESAQSNTQPMAMYY